MLARELRPWRAFRQGRDAALDADSDRRVHTDIVGNAYTRVTPYRRGETIELQQFPDVRVPVADVIR